MSVFLPSSLRTDAEFQLEQFMYSEIEKRLKFWSKRKLKRTLLQMGYAPPNTNFRKWFLKFVNNEIELCYGLLTHNIFSTEQLVSVIKEGAIIAVVGERGSGKTDFALLLAERLGFKIVSNILLEDIDYFFCNDNKTLKQIFKVFKEPKTVIIDEAGVIFSAYQTVFAEHLRLFVQEQTYTRKDRSVFIYIIPELEHLSAPLRREARLVINKKNRINAIVYGKDEPIPKIITNIKPTQLKFNTLQRADWYVSQKQSKKLDDYNK